MKALIHEELVVQIAMEEFPVHPTLTWIDIAGITPQPETGWSFVGSVFSPPLQLPLLPQQELDITELRSSVDKLAFILTELCVKLLAQGTIQVDDFTPKVKAIFLDIKAIVDRAKPQ